MAVDDKILARIHKLLSLATSDNENEAANAAAKAQTMLMEYNISEDELNGFSERKNERVVEIVSDKKNAHNRTVWMDLLANTVALANLCKLLISWKGLIWIGKPTNIEVAQYIYENLVRDLQRICENTWAVVNWEQMEEPKWNRVHGKTWKNNFYHGANQSIRTRLNANLRQLEEAQPQIGSMIVLNDTEIKEYMNIKYPRLTTSHHNMNYNRSGFEAGKAAGQSVQFRSGVGAGGSTGPRLLNKGK